MPTPNPHYDPQASVKYEAEMKNSQIWFDMMGQWLEIYGAGSAEHKRAFERCTHYSRLSEAAFRTCYPTVQEYAEWYFARLPIEGNTIVMRDFERLTSIEQVWQVWKEEADKIRELRESSYNLPVGQPDGLTVFADGDTMLSTWRDFDGADLNDERLPEYVLQCIVSFQQADRRYHFCLTHKWGDGSPGVINLLEKVATVIAFETLGIVHPGSSDILKRRSRRLLNPFQTRRLLAEIENFDFYLHVPPKNGRREKFQKVGLRWEGDRFQASDTAFAGYNRIPSGLRQHVDRLMGVEPQSHRRTSPALRLERPTIEANGEISGLAR